MFHPGARVWPLCIGSIQTQPCLVSPGGMVAPWAVLPRDSGEVIGVSISHGILPLMLHQLSLIAISIAIGSPLHKGAHIPAPISPLVILRERPDVSTESVYLSLPDRFWHSLSATYTLFELLGHMIVETWSVCWLYFSNNSVSVYTYSHYLFVLFAQHWFQFVWWVTILCPTTLKYS